MKYLLWYNEKINYNIKGSICYISKFISNKKELCFRNGQKGCNYILLINSFSIHNNKIETKYNTIIQCHNSQTTIFMTHIYKWQSRGHNFKRHIFIKHPVIIIKKQYCRQKKQYCR